MQLTGKKLNPISASTVMAPATRKTDYILPFTMVIAGAVAVTWLGEVQKDDQGNVITQDMAPLGLCLRQDGQIQKACVPVLAELEAGYFPSQEVDTSGTMVAGCRFVVHLVDLSDTHQQGEYPVLMEHTKGWTLDDFKAKGFLKGPAEEDIFINGELNPHYATGRITLNVIEGFRGSGGRVGQTYKLINGSGVGGGYVPMPQIKRDDEEYANRRPSVDWSKLPGVEGFLQQIVFQYMNMDFDAETKATITKIFTPSSKGGYLGISAAAQRASQKEQKLDQNAGPSGTPVAASGELPSQDELNKALATVAAGEGGEPTVDENQDA